MEKYTMKMIFSKSKPLIILTFEVDTELRKRDRWKKKFKEIDKKTYHISTTFIQEVFEENEGILGKWKDAKIEPSEVKQYYGFTKIKGMEIHALELTKRFIGDWLEEYTKLYRYKINYDNPEMPPIIKECLYDAGIYGNGEVGNITTEEVDILRRILSPDGEIITKMREKLAKTN